MVTRKDVDALGHFAAGSKAAERALTALAASDLPLKEVCEAIREEIAALDIYEVPDDETAGQIKALRTALERADLALQRELALAAQIAQCEAKVASLGAHLTTLRNAHARARSTLRLTGRKPV